MNLMAQATLHCKTSNWPSALMGFGNSMLEDELSLYDEAKSVAEILLQKPRESLDEHAIALRDFLLTVC